MEPAPFASIQAAGDKAEHACLVSVAANVLR